jgi:hypothetical protein
MEVLVTLHIQLGLALQALVLTEVTQAEARASIILHQATLHQVVVLHLLQMQQQILAAAVQVEKIPRRAWAARVVQES